MNCLKKSDFSRADSKRFVLSLPLPH